jgi:hypothetical protein
MNQPQNTGFADRLKAASEAKKAMLAKFQPKPAVPDPLFEERAAMRAAELEAARKARAEAKAAAKQALAEAEAAVAAAALEAKRGERKERKVLTKAEQKAKRDARYAARKAR